MVVPEKAAKVLAIKYPKKTKDKPFLEDFNNSPVLLKTKEARVLKNRLDNWFIAWKKRTQERPLIQVADHSVAYFSLLKLLCLYDIKQSGLMPDKEEHDE
jgi:hypothetical protein